MSKKWYEGLVPIPSHVVIETEDCIYIDGFRVEFVVKDSVKTEELSPGQTIVHLSFIAKDFIKVD